MPVLIITSLSSWVGIGIAAIASMTLGMLWYSGALFGKQWLEYLGMTEADIAAEKSKSMVWSYVATFVATILTAYALTLFMQSIAFVPNIVAALTIGLVAAVGFVVTTHTTDFLFNPRKKKVGLLYITVGYYVASILIQSFILYFFN